MRLLSLVPHDLICRHNKTCHLHPPRSKLVLGVQCVGLSDDDLQHVNFVWGCCGNADRQHLISGLFTSTKGLSLSFTDTPYPSHLSFRLLLEPNSQTCLLPKLNPLLLRLQRRPLKRRCLFSPCTRAISANHGPKRSCKSNGLGMVLTDE
jgi:hypothetical protein